MENYKITQKEIKEEFKEIKKYFNLDFIGSIENKNSIMTKWGKYNFYFDNNSIFGKFEDLIIENLPPKIQNFKDDIYEIIYYPGLTGKMNFHFDQIFDFIDTIDRILIDDELKK